MHGFLSHFLQTSNCTFLERLPLAFLYKMSLLLLVPLHQDYPFAQHLILPVCTIASHCPRDEGFSVHTAIAIKEE